MHARYIVLIFSLFFTGLFTAQVAFSHLPSLHDDTTQSQKNQLQTVQQQSRQQDQTVHLEHDDNMAADHHDDTVTAAHEHADRPMADHRASNSESSEHSHNGGGHDEGGSEAGGHSHWGISPDSSPLSKFMAAIGKFHPLIVHFPIALFLTAAFAQVLNIGSKDGVYDKTVFLLVWVGAVGALASALLGWAHSGPMQAGESVIMSSHRWLGTSLLIGGFITVFFMTKANKTEGGLKGNTVFSALLFAMAFGVAVNGFLGGTLAHLHTS